MAIKVLALASSVTGLTDHRILNGAMLTSDGQLAVRGGVLPGATSGDLSTVSAMVARVAPVKVVIPNSISAALGPYVLVSDANVDITFDAGEAAVPRVDRVIARAYDDTNDGSGSTLGNIYYLKGTAGGSATALPNNSVLLYEMTIPAGASAGGGGVNFANAVDKRVYTVSQGGVIPIANATDMAAITNLYEGMTIYRNDLDTLYVGAGSNFYPRGQISVASSANLTDITNAYDGLLAVTRDTDYIYVYNGSTWILRGGNYERLYDQRTSDASTISSTTLVSVLSVTLTRTGTYQYDALIPFTNITNVGRPGFALGGTSTATAWRWTGSTVHYNSATGSQASSGSGTTYPGSTSGGAIVNSDLTTTTGHSSFHLKGTVTVSAAGTLQFRFSEASGSGGVSVKAGAMVTVDFISA